MNLEDIQTAWQQNNERVDRLEESLKRLTHEITGSNKPTALRNLARRYTIFACISLIMIPVWCYDCLASDMFGHTPTQQLIAGIFGMCYFALAAILDFILTYKVKSIDIYRSPVTTVLRRTLQCRRFHHIAMMILIPLCIILLGMIIYFNSSNIYLIMGIICGATLGLVIGIRAYLRFMGDYREITGSDD